MSDAELKISVTQKLKQGVFSLRSSTNTIHKSGNHFLLSQMKQTKKSHMQYLQALSYIHLL